MVPCSPGKQPPRFQRLVGKPGRAWLEANKGSGKRPRPYWTQVLDDLWKAFDKRCAYLGTFLGTPGSVDHFVSIDQDRSAAYRWANYRHAANWVNSRKRAVPWKEIVDPVSVGPGWFRLTYPGLHLEVGPKCPRNMRRRAEFTLDRLGLRRDRRTLLARAEFLRCFFEGTPLRTIRRWAPLVAEVIEREGLKPRPVPRRRGRK